MIPPFLYKWIAIGVVIVLLGGALIWTRHDLKVARESQAVAERQAAISAADAERWQKASDERDVRLGQLSTALDEQSALVAAGRAKEAALRTSLDNARQQNDRLQADNDQLSKDLDDEERQAPADIRDVGPIVARRAPGLFAD